MVCNDVSGSPSVDTTPREQIIRQSLNCEQNQESLLEILKKQCLPENESQELIKLPGILINKFGNIQPVPE